jgi:hypothetical protein
LYVAGGIASSRLLAPPISTVSLLPGYTADASPVDVGRLSETPGSATIEPGWSLTVTVTVDAGAPEITGPGD